MEMDTAQNIHEAGLSQFESLWLWTQSSVTTRWDLLCGLILQKICGLFVRKNETVRYIRVSVLSGCPLYRMVIYL